MLAQNSPDRIRIIFDDHRLVANAGLLLPATLALHLGLGELVDSHLDLGSAPGRANTGDKVMTLVASALPGRPRSSRTTRACGRSSTTCWTCSCPGTETIFSPSTARTGPPSRTRSPGGWRSNCRGWCTGAACGRPSGPAPGGWTSRPSTCCAITGGSRPPRPGPTRMTPPWPWSGLGTAKTACATGRATRPASPDRTEGEPLGTTDRSRWLPRPGAR